MASKVKKENHIVLQGWMISELNLKGNELIVYAIIYGFSQTEGQLYTGSLQYLADWTNSTKQGVSKNLKSLVEKGYISKNEKFVNGVKFCEYYATKFNRVCNKVEQGIQQSLIPPIQQSLTNNIEIDNIEDNIENKKNIKKENFEEEFETLWSKYPVKQGKTNALKSFTKARINGVEYETISKGLGKYLEYCKATEWYRPKNGSTWFNQQSWNDEYIINKKEEDIFTNEKIDLKDFV